MGNVIGEVLPLALSVAISPIPIIAVILMLLSARAGLTSSTFFVGWLLGIIAALTVFIVLADLAGMNSDSSSSPVWVGVLKLVLGAICLLLAMRQWRGRPRPGEEPTMPKWLASIERMKARTAFVLGFGLSAINPKNLIMLIGGGVTIGSAGLTFGGTALATGIFTVIAGCTVALPLIVYFAVRTAATAWLTNLKAWLAQNNATVMTVLFLVIGVALIGKGIAGF